MQAILTSQSPASRLLQSVVDTTAFLQQCDLPISSSLLKALTVVSTLLVFGVPQGAAADDVVKMAPFVVEASSGTPWRYFSVSGFEVLSRCPESFNETYARALQQNAAARAALFPPGFLPDLPTPIKIILYCKPRENESAATGGDPIDLQLSPLTDAFLEDVSIEQASPIVVDDGDTFIVCGNYSSMVRDVRDLSQIEGITRAVTSAKALCRSSP